MQRLPLLLLATLFLPLFQCFSAESELSPAEVGVKKAAGALLLKGIKNLVNSDAGKKYFAGVDVNAIKIQDQKNIPSADGWIVRWGFRQGMTMVPNPDKNMQVVEIPVITEESGILFEIFITYKHGGAFVSRTENYPVSGAPDINVAVDLMTKNPDPILSEEIKQVCTTIQGALKANLDKSHFPYQAPTPML